MEMVYGDFGRPKICENYTPMMTWQHQSVPCGLVGDRLIFNDMLTWPKENVKHGTKKW